MERNFAVNILLAGALGPERFGYWALGWLLVALLTAVHNVLVQVPGQVLARTADGQLDEPFFRATAQLAVLSAALGAGLVLAGIVIASLVARFPVVEGLGFVPLAFGWMLIEYNRRGFLVVGRQAVANIFEAVRAVGSVLACVVLILWFNGPALLSLSLWVLGLLMFGIGLSGTYLLVGRQGAARIDLRAAMRRCWLYSRWMLPTAVSSRFGPDLSLSFAGLLLGPAAIGGFRAMLQIASVFNVLFQTLVVVLPVRYGDIYRRLGNRGLWAETKKLTAAYALLCGIALVLAELFAADVVRLLLGSKYVEYTPILSWLIVMYFFFLVHVSLTGWLHALAASSRFLVPNLAGAGAILLLVVPLTNAFGIVGLAVGMVVMYAVEVSGLALSVWLEIRRRQGEVAL